MIKPRLYIIKCCMEEKKYDKALKFCKEILLDYKKESEPYFLMGKIKELQNNFTEALIDYTKAISLNENSADFYFARASLNSKLNAHKEAINDYTKAIALQPNPLFYKLRGIEYFLEDYYNAALYDYEKSIELSNLFLRQIVIYHTNSGLEKVKEKKYIKALNNYDIITKLEPNNYFGWYGKSVCLYGIKQFEDALQMIEKASDIKSSDASLYNLKGDCFYSLKNYEKAIHSYEIAISLNPNNAVYKNNIAQAKKILHSNEISTKQYVEYEDLEFYFDEGSNEYSDMYIDLEWYKTMWKRLEKRGLTGFLSVEEKKNVACRALSLITLYFDFCYHAYISFEYPRDYPHFEYYGWSYQFDNSNIVHKSGKIWESKVKTLNDVCSTQIYYEEALKIVTIERQNIIEIIMEEAQVLKNAEEFVLIEMLYGDGKDIYDKFLYNYPINEESQNLRYGRFDISEMRYHYNALVEWIKNGMQPKCDYLLASTPNN